VLSPFRTRGRPAAVPAQPAGAAGRLTKAALAMSLAVAGLLFFAGCQRLQRADLRPLDQAGMWFRSVEELRQLSVSDSEVPELVKARQAGISDDACIELVRIARGRKQPFAHGDAIINLRRAEVSEFTVLELARLDQLGFWVGEAQALRLAGLSDQVLLAVARRRAAGQPVLSGPSLAKLKNAGLSEAEVLPLIERGTTDEQSTAIVAARRRAAGGTTFVRYRRRR